MGDLKNRGETKKILLREECQRQGNNFARELCVTLIGCRDTSSKNTFMELLMRHKLKHGLQGLDYQSKAPDISAVDLYTRASTLRTQSRL